MPYLTLSALSRRGVCPESIAALREAFPEGEAEVSEANCLRVAHRVHWVLAARRLLSQKGFAEWRAEMELALGPFPWTLDQAYGLAAAIAFAKIYRKENEPSAQEK